MKRLLFSSFLFVNSAAAFAQVTISSPYDYGQSKVVINITYPTTIVAADSVVLEVDYDIQEYKRASSAKGLPKILSQEYSFKFQFTSNRKYRIAVYQKGKEVVYSNEIDIYFNAQFKYSDTGLPSVTNVKATLIEKDGARYLHVTWTTVTGALAYRLFTKEGETMIWEANEGDDGYMHTTSYDFLINRTSEFTYVIGIGAIEGPNDNTDVPKIVNTAKVTVPGL